MRSEYPVDEPITDTNMSALSFACALPDTTEAMNINNTRMIELILDQKCPNINFRDNFGRTPLHHACNSGNLSAVKVLISRGLDAPHPKLNGQILNVNAQSIGGETPLMKAAACGNIDICVLLI